MNAVLTILGYLVVNGVAIAIIYYGHTTKVITVPVSVSLSFIVLSVTSAVVLMTAKPKQDSKSFHEAVFLLLYLVPMWALIALIVL